MDCLPTLHIGNEAIGELRQEVASELGLPAGLPVAIGGGDNMMGAIGTGTLSAGKMTMSLGTSGTVYACSDTPVVDPKGKYRSILFVYRWLAATCLYDELHGEH